MTIAVSPVANDFATLKRLIKQRGLLEKQPTYYIPKILLTLSLFLLA